MTTTTGRPRIERWILAAAVIIVIGTAGCVDVDGNQLGGTAGTTSNSNPARGGSVATSSPVGGANSSGNGGAVGVPPPAEGAVSITVQNSAEATAGYGCGSAHVLTLGEQAPNPTSQGATWIDGLNGHNVSCTVTSNGTYDITANISGNSSNFQISATGLQVGSVGTATVNFFDLTLMVAMRSTNGCTISLSGGNFTVEPGAIWASVSCGHLQSQDDMYLWCAASGVIVFKSCDK